MFTLDIYKLEIFVSVIILPGYAVRDEQTHGLLRAVAIEGQPLHRMLKLLWCKASRCSPIARAFLAHLGEAFPVLRQPTLLADSY